MRNNKLIYLFIVIIAYISLLLFCSIISGESITLRGSEKILIIIVLFLLHRYLYKDKLFHLISIIFLGIIYFSIIFIKYYVGEIIDIGELYKYLLFIFSLLNLLIIVIAFNNKFKIVVSLILLVVTLSPILLFWSYFFTAHTVLNSNAILAILQTNITEALAYINDNTNIYNYIILILFFCILIIMSIKLKTLHLNRKISLVLLLIMLSDIFIVNKYKENILTNIFIQANSSLKEYDNFKKQAKQRKENIKNLLVVNSNEKDGIYVLVIGESQNKMHMSAYGYNKETTPWLNSMKNDDNFILLRNAYSCHTHTVQNLTYALTAKNQYNDILIEQAPSIIEVAEASGYETVWLSNQVKYSAWDTPVTIIANEANQQDWINENSGESTKTNFYDLKLLDSIEKINISNKMLIIIHLMGNHGNYHDRYPDEFNKYSGDIGTYDNSILYNDYVMKNIYQRVKQLPHFKGLIYFADHSEAVDEGLSHDSGNFRSVMTYIPVYMYFSEEYLKENPEKFNTLKNSQQKYFTNDLIFNAVLGIMNINLENLYEPQNDVTNKIYDDNRQRFKTLYGKKFLSEVSKE